MGYKIEKAVECPECGNEYKMLGGHWTKNTCTPPEVTDRQMDLLEGSLLGDGSFTGDGHSQFTLSITNKEFLEWFDNQFGVFTTGVKQVMTKKQSRDSSVNSGTEIAGSLDVEDYKEVWSVKSRSIDAISSLYSKWYRPEKQLPKNFSLNPTKLKMWYVQDGDFHTSGSSFQVRITTSFDYERVYSMFSKIGIEPGSKYEKIAGTGTYRLTFNSGETEDIFKYIGGSVPGFSYKWPDK